MAEICLKGLNCFLCLCAMKIFYKTFLKVWIYMRRFEEQNNFLLLFRSLTSALFQTRQYYLSPHLSAETTWKKRKFEFHGCTFDIFSEAIHQKKMHMLWRISLYAGGCERGERGAKLPIFLMQIGSDDFP